jgi:hypothetical protein
LAFIFSAFTVLITVGGLVNALSPKSLLNQVIELLVLLVSPIYSFYVLLDALRGWRGQNSLAHPSYLKKRQHDSGNVRKLLAEVPDKAVLKDALEEYKRELGELRETSSSFTGAIKDVPALFLAVVAIMAIRAGLKNEDVSLYPAALLAGSLATVVAYFMQFPLFNRVRLFSYRVYILERAVDSVGAAGRDGYQPAADAL